MSDSAEPPFTRTHLLDKPGIVGAKWWQEGLATHDPIARRQALLAIAVLGVTLVGVGAVIAVASPSRGPDTTTTMFGALDMQRKYGWSFGAADEALTFDGQSQQPFEKAALDRMVTEISPAQPRLKRFSSPTLFQSPAATPTAVPEGDTTHVTPLREALRPIFTPAMDTAYRSGKSLSSIFEGMHVDAAIVVDLPGPQAIAFAAGLAGSFDPCFTFENWPHPRGVVPAHLSLAAAVYYQPLFARTTTSRKQPAPPALVLDRARLAPYTDDAREFDNRYAAKLPTVASLKELGVHRVLYVVPTGNDMVELDDLNEQLVAYAAAGIDVKLIAVTDFGPEIQPPSPTSAARPSPDDPIYYYGSSAASHQSFWPLYRWGPARDKITTAANVSTGYIYVPRARTTPFSSAVTPTGFGLVPVVVVVATGAILGARLSRSGSWNRASSGS